MMSAHQWSVFHSILLSCEMKDFESMEIIIKQEKERERKAIKEVVKE